MIVKETGIEGVYILEPRVFTDSRGSFQESYHQERFRELGFMQDFVQDNQSHSVFGVIRGLHFQKPPYEQTKLVRVVSGTIYDVAVDLRPLSSTYGKWFGIELSAENSLQLLIPGGFAHGFSVLSDEATVFYKCNAYYHPASESGIRFDDPDLDIDWRLDPESEIISDKDRNLHSFKDLKTDQL